MRGELDKLSELIGYRFENPELLEIAVTHRSVGSNHNERFEFLGDAVLAFVVSAELFARYPDSDEGSLSRLRAAVVKGETLAKIARKLELGDYLRLGSGELKSGGFRRDSILADALEAIIGSVYLDTGIESAKALIMGLFDETLANLSPDLMLKDPKTRLQEYLQSRRLPLPSYTVATIDGDAHAQTFIVNCQVDVLSAPVEGRGSSRRKAEQSAAKAALTILEQHA